MDRTEIRALRAALGMTRTGFAERMQVSYHTIVSWELGKSSPGGPAVALLRQLESLVPRPPKEKKKSGLTEAGRAGKTYK